MEEKNEDFISINFKALIGVIWAEKLLIISSIFLFTTLGVIYILKTPKEFISEGKILPEISGGASSSLGGLANLVGIGGFELGLKNNTEAIRPDLYPDVISSTPFFLDLFEQQFVNKDGDSTTFEEFYYNTIEGGREIDSLEIIKFKANPSGIIILNELSENRIEDLKSRITAAIDSKSGVISFTAKMPDPVIGAQVTEFAMKYLTDYVTEYRIQKTRTEITFLKEKLDNARSEYYSDQNKKATYADQYSSSTIRLKSADVNRERIESEYRMSSNLYNTLLEKYEEARLKLQQETPVFKVLNPSLAPTKESEPKKTLIIFATILIGGVIGFLWAIFKNGNYKKFI